MLIDVDNWGFERLYQKYFKDLNGDNHNNVVHELLEIGKCMWDRDNVYDLYGEFRGKLIYEVPLIQDGPSDRVSWFHNKNGHYSTKSRYSWLILKKFSLGPHKSFWRTISKLCILPKIHVFAWRVGHDLLPTNGKIFAVNHNVNRGCLRCGDGNETVIHAQKLHKSLNGSYHGRS